MGWRMRILLIGPALALSLSACGQTQLGSSQQTLSAPLLVSGQQHLRPRARACACPKDRDSYGQMCGARSAYTRASRATFDCTGRI